MLSDDQLIKGCRKQDRIAQKELYKKYAPTMRGICLRYVNNASEAQDILQLGFVKVFSNIRQYSAKGSFEGWIKRIIINTASTYYRRNLRMKNHVSLDMMQEMNIPDDNISLMESEIDEKEIDVNKIDIALIKKADFSTEELLEVTRILPIDFRMVFNLFYIEHFKHHEIAKMLKINANTSRTRLKRAKEILKKQLYKLSIEKLTK